MMELEEEKRLYNKCLREGLHFQAEIHKKNYLQLEESAKEHAAKTRELKAKVQAAKDAMHAAIEAHGSLSRELESHRRSDPKYAKKQDSKHSGVPYYEAGRSRKPTPSGGMGR